MAFLRLSLLLICFGLTTVGGTATAPRATPVKKAPVKKAPPTTYDRYAAFAARHGLTVRRTTVLGLRGVAKSGRRHDVGDNMSDYDDTFVVLEPKRHLVHRFTGATHAGQSSSTLAPAGVAQVQPGRYRAIPYGDYADMPCWLVLTRGGSDDLPCWRDADHDGVIGKREKRQTLTADAILFHSGRYADHPSSIGCQTLPPQVMRQFIAAIGVHQEFDFLLVEAGSHG